MKTNWPTKKLGEVIDFQKGKKMAVSEEQKLGYKPYIGIDTIRTQKYNLYTPEKDGVRCAEDDVVVVWDGAHAGTVGIEVSGFAGSTVAKIVIREPKLDSRFLRYFWEFNESKIRGAAQGAAVPHLSKAFIDNLKIPVPPLEIQKKLVERLDGIREAQKLNNELIQKTEELFASLLHKELNPVAKNWEIKKLGELCEFQYGYTASAQDEGDYRLIRITDINESGELRNSDPKYVKANSETKKYVLNQENLLVARTGATYGKILFYDSNEPAVFASYLIRIIPDEKLVLPKFIWIFSRTKEYWTQAERLMTGSGQQQFNANKIKHIEIPVPGIETQKEIVQKLNAVQEYKKGLLEQKTKLRELFDSVLYRSMAGELDMVN
ncbi:MAG: restriction endonuclease subunit S [Candidatus Wildermuthbacteria bacterium]|nr:restriction endonuclease subunit S [Candidatus Wildermuthbacteria bacterium]